MVVAFRVLGNEHFLLFKFVGLTSSAFGFLGNGLLFLKAFEFETTEVFELESFPIFRHLSVANMMWASTAIHQAPFFANEFVIILTRVRDQAMKKKAKSVK